MNHESWLEKAERLRVHLDGLPHDVDKTIAIAIWLRLEFSEERPNDTATMALFPREASLR
jgi:hypothetical protein